MKALIVVPFHDPCWAERTRANVSRQTAQLPALLVRNGAARTFASDFSEVTHSGGSHADAVNAGVAWARSHGFAHVVLFDSDDYYGPRYVEKVLSALGAVDFCGQQRLFAQLQDGSLHLMQRPGRCFVFATIGFRVASFVPVSDQLDNCAEWTGRLLAKGATWRENGPEGYCYFRHGRNAHWDGRLTDPLVRAAWGPSLNYGRVPVGVCDAPEDWGYTECPLPTTEEIFAGMATMPPAIATSH